MRQKHQGKYFFFFKFFYALHDSLISRKVAICEQNLSVLLKGSGGRKSAELDISKTFGLVNLTVFAVQA